MKIFILPLLIVVWSLPASADRLSDLKKQMSQSSGGGAVASDSREVNFMYRKIYIPTNQQSLADRLKPSQVPSERESEVKSTGEAVSNEVQETSQAKSSAQEKQFKSSGYSSFRAQQAATGNYGLSASGDQTSPQASSYSQMQINTGQNQPPGNNTQTNNQRIDGQSHAYSSRANPSALDPNSSKEKLKPTNFASSNFNIARSGEMGVFGSGSQSSNRSVGSREGSTSSFFSKLAKALKVDKFFGGIWGNTSEDKKDLSGKARSFSKEGGQSAQKESLKTPEEVLNEQLARYKRHLASQAEFGDLHTSIFKRVCLAYNSFEESIGQPVERISCIDF